MPELKPLPKYEATIKITVEEKDLKAAVYSLDMNLNELDQTKKVEIVEIKRC